MRKIIRYPFFGFIVVLICAGLLLISWPHNEKAILENQIKKITANVKQEINHLERDALGLIEAAEKDSISFFLSEKNSQFPFAIFKNSKLVYWNNSIIVPEHNYVDEAFELKFIRIPEGLFLVRKWSFDNKNELIGLIPLYRSSKINNRYISSHYNKNIFTFQPERVVEPILSTGNDICIDGNCLFQVELNEEVINAVTSKYDQWGSICLLIAFFSIVAALMNFRKALFKKFGTTNGLIIITFLIVAIRLIMLWVSFPRDAIHISVFDATIFASSWLNPTLGDLLINLLLLLVIVVSFYIYRTHLLNKLNSSRIKLFWGLIILMIYFYSSLLMYLLVQTIYHNSQISLDINQNLMFDPLRITAFLILLIVAFLAFIIGHIIIKFLNESVSEKERIGLIAIGFILFILIALFDNIMYSIPAAVTTIFLAIVSFTQLYRSILKIRFATYIYIFTWAVAASIIIGFAIMNMEEEEEYENQVKFADKFLVENDALAEFLLHELNQKIQDDLYIQSRLSSPYLGKDVIKDKIRQIYLSDYFDKYEINIYIFDAQGRPYNPLDFMLRPIDIQSSNQKYQTSYANIYYIDEPGDEHSGRYLDLIEVKKRGLRVGYILLDLRLKKLIPENVYPELLVDHRFLQSFQNRSYSYAVFRDKRIIYTSGRFNYTNNFSFELIGKEKLFTKGLEVNNYQHKAVKDAEGNIYIISVPAHTVEHFFSNFSFFFLLVVFVVMVISLIYAISFIMRGSELYYSARIQLYLSLAFFIPMLVVTIITLSLVSKSFKEEVVNENVKKAENISKNIAEDLVNEPYENQVISLLLRASRYANADANIFTPGGRLIATSQPRIYENDLLAPYINPKAIVNINYRNEQLFTADESVGDLEFKTTYHSIRSPDTGNLIGILSVPFFQSEVALERHEIDIFTNVIDIFTLIFILFLVISYLASEYLIFPLKIITRKLQKTSLEFNEPLSWEANDEIGLMVREYNRMVVNLEESKKALAKSEKESAWREMAQQVAHEIKNPLTPMKLTLQHLQRTLTDKDNHYKKSINTLLQQVNILSEIAGSFSAFASMPSPSKEKFDLQQLTLNSASLFSKNKGINLHVETVDRRLVVEADEKLMGRIISNIIINAIEAGEGYQLLKIDIKLEPQSDDNVILSIADNGPGIEEGVREKIFMPHFSTKRRGSGIGLAIARRGIEHAGGKIWFETEEGKGTTFFIMLPLANA